MGALPVKRALVLFSEAQVRALMSAGGEDVRR